MQLQRENLILRRTRRGTSGRRPGPGRGRVAEARMTGTLKKGICSYVSCLTKN